MTKKNERKMACTEVNKDRCKNMKNKLASKARRLKVHNEVNELRDDKVSVA